MAAGIGSCFGSTGGLYDASAFEKDDSDDEKPFFSTEGDISKPRPRSLSEERELKAKAESNAALAAAMLKEKMKKEAADAASAAAKKVAQEKGAAATTSPAAAPPSADPVAAKK